MKKFLLFNFLITLFSFQHLTVIGQTKDPKKMIEQLKTKKGNERNKVLLKIIEYYYEPEPGKALSYANEIIRNTKKGDTSIRFTAYTKALYLTSYLNDRMNFILLEKEIKEEYQSHPEKSINSLYLIASIHCQVFNDYNEAFENILEGEKLVRRYKKNEIGKYLISKAVLFQYQKKFNELEVTIDQYKKLPNHLKTSLTEHIHLLIELKKAIKIKDIDFISKNTFNYYSYFNTKDYKSISDGPMEDVPNFLDVCNLFIFVNKFDSAMFFLNKTRFLMKNNHIPYLKKYYFTVCKNYYNAVNKKDIVDLYSDSIDLVNQEINEYNRQQIFNYYNQEKKFISRFNNENILRLREQSSKYMWMFLFTLILLLGFFVVFINQRRSNLNKNLAQELLLKTEQMKLSLAQKNQVLTEKTLRLANQNDVLLEVRSKLKSVKNKMNGATSKDLNYILGIVSTRTSEKQWEEFQLYFYELYSNFYKNLIEQHPDLTPNERRLCAFLKLNMSSKSISMITGQSLKSIDIARGRLRGKFNLKNKTISFVEYFDQLES